MAVGISEIPPLAFMSSSGSRRWRSGYPHDRGGAGGVGESGGGAVVRRIEFWFAMIKVTTIIVMIVIGWA